MRFAPFLIAVAALVSGCRDRHPDAVESPLDLKGAKPMDMSMDFGGVPYEIQTMKLETPDLRPEYAEIGEVALSFDFTRINGEDWTTVTIDGTLPEGYSCEACTQDASWASFDPVTGEMEVGVHVQIPLSLDEDALTISKEFVALGQAEVVKDRRWRRDVFSWNRMTVSVYEGNPSRRDIRTENWLIHGELLPTVGEFADE